MAEVIIQPNPTDGKDAHVAENDAGGNYGTVTYFEVGFRPATGTKYRGYIQFPLTDIPSGSTIDSAVLELYNSGTDENVTSQTTMSLNLVTASWAEATVTWNTQPAFDAGAITTATWTGNTTGWRSWTITTTVQNWLDGSVANYGVCLKQNSEASAVLAAIFRSSDYTDDTSLRPKLTVNYTAPSGNAIFFGTNF